MFPRLNENTRKRMLLTQNNLILNIVIQILFQNHSSLKNIENKIKSLKVKVYFDKCSVCMHIPIAYKKIRLNL